VNTEAQGPDEIRSAFNYGQDMAENFGTGIGGMAAALDATAERYQGLGMHPDTIAHISEAAEETHTAQSAMDRAGEALSAALSDFNVHDGAVADTVADTGGNVADEEVIGVH
jgi:DNA-binding ferritin-like protein